MISAPRAFLLEFKGISRGGLDATLPRPRARKSAPPRAGENLCEKMREEQRETWCEKLCGKKRRPPLERGAPFFSTQSGPHFSTHCAAHFSTHGGGHFSTRSGGDGPPEGGGRNALPLKQARRRLAKPVIKMHKPKIRPQNPTIFHSATSPA